MKCTAVYATGRFPRLGPIRYRHCSSERVRDDGRRLVCLSCGAVWVPVGRVNEEWVLVRKGREEIGKLAQESLHQVLSLF